MDVSPDLPIRTLRLESHIQVLAVALSPDGTLLSTAGWDHEPRGVDMLLPNGLENSVCIRDLDSGCLLPTLTGHRSGVVSIVFSPDGRSLASGSADRTMKLWEIHSGRLEWAAEGPWGVGSIAFSPDGQMVASADGAAKLWDAHTGQLRREFVGSTEQEVLLSVALSPDGKLLAAGTIFGLKGPRSDVLLWDVQTGQLIRRLTGNSGAGRSVAFSPDGALLASTGGGGEAAWEFSVGVTLWDVTTGQPRVTLPPGRHTMIPYGFSPDGKTLLTGGETVQLWDTSTGGLQRTIEVGRSGVYSLCLSADGKMLAGACDGDNTVRLWQLS